MSKLNVLNAWKEGAQNFFASRSAQGFMGGGKVALATVGAGGSACGAGDEQPKPSACGAGDETKEKPSACGSACGAGDEK